MEDECHLPDNDDKFVKIQNVTDNVIIQVTPNRRCYAAAGYLKCLPPPCGSFIFVTHTI